LSSITLRKSFQTLDDTRQRPVHFSPHEPWRAFRSSLAIQFTSRKPGGWSPDTISDDTKAEIIDGLEARSAIVRSYSSTLSTMRDLVAKAGLVSQVGDQCHYFGASMRELSVRIRQLESEAGPLAANRQLLQSSLDRFEAAAEALNLVVHGFVEVREERSGSIVFRFNQWSKRQSYSSRELEAKAISLELLATQAKGRLAIAHASL
jgi:hypothetical protein